MRSSNPVLPANTFARPGAELSLDHLMSVQGVVWKTFLLLALVVLGAGWTWNLFLKAGSNPAAVNGWLLGGAIGGFILALATAFKPTWSPITAPLYAAFEGVFIGGISALMEQAFPGIVIQASMLTFGTLAAMLLLYQTGIIRVTDTFKKVVFSATGGIAIAYLLTWVLSFFGVNVPFIYGNGIAGIIFSLVVIGVAALNFVLDFDFIEEGANKGAPKYMEWYGAFALMVTLIWLYIEFLRLLSKLRER
jgi:uncharacterized YccA/Bax inhibitor family protein